MADAASDEPRIETADWLMEQANAALLAADLEPLPAKAAIHRQAAERWLKLARLKGRAHQHTALRYEALERRRWAIDAPRVVVTDDALNALWGDDAGADHRVSLLLEYEHILANIARTKLRDGRAESDGAVLITAQDILN